MDLFESVLMLSQLITGAFLKARLVFQFFKKSSTEFLTEFAELKITKFYDNSDILILSMNF